MESNLSLASAASVNAQSAREGSRPYHAMYVQAPFTNSDVMVEPTTF